MGNVVGKHKIHKKQGVLKFFQKGIQFNLNQYSNFNFQLIGI